jgi:hypothetical protein
VGGTAKAHPSRRHGAVDAHGLTQRVEPDEIECEAHAERVDAAAGVEPQGVGRRVAPQGEAEQALAASAGAADGEGHAS